MKKTTHSIGHIREDCKGLILDNGIEFLFYPSELNLISTWRNNDEVEIISQNSNSIYNYKLFNLNKGNSILAKKYFE